MFVCNADLAAGVNCVCAHMLVCVCVYGCVCLRVYVCVCVCINVCVHQEEGCPSSSRPSRYTPAASRAPSATAALSSVTPLAAPQVTPCRMRIALPMALVSIYLTCPAPATSTDIHLVYRPDCWYLSELLSSTESTSRTDLMCMFFGSESESKLLFGDSLNFF